MTFAQKLVNIASRDQARNIFGGYMVSKSLFKKCRTIVEAMNGIGLKVVDLSTYTADYIGEKASEIVIVGYVPHYAAIFSVHTGASSDITFMIDGQVRDDDRFAPASGHRFGKIPRPVNAGEIFGRLDFGINIYLPSIQEKDHIQKGMDFFEKFMELYFRFLEHYFTEDVFLHVADPHSDEYKMFASRYGPTSVAGQKFFEDRIKKKLPRGFFPIRETDPVSACG